MSTRARRSRTFPAVTRTVVRLATRTTASNDDVAGARLDPPWLSQWLDRAKIRSVRTVGELTTLLRRSRPDIVLLDARDGDGRYAAAACAECKADPYTALVPCVVIGADNGSVATTTAGLLGAGADEVLPSDMAADEALARLDGIIRRASRDLWAQPTTGLPGPPAIEALLTARLREGTAFAACYADLDHFKEYNDRYGFREGDRVIRVVARLLHDVAVGVAGAAGFVGHIGGDDFLCVLPLAVAPEACALIVETFDLLAPLQYNAADQRAGYYLGKDRRGQLHRVPLMTLSLGVATTERRRFESAAEVGRLASEMKTFAKTQAGSVFAFDRRGDDGPPSPTSSAEIV